jgi:hypothetical protein
MAWRALRRGLLIGVIATLSHGAPASAHHVFAQWVGQSEFPTMESGDVVTSFFDARNIGSGVWERGYVRLGTSQPRDRASAFYDPDHWLQPDRAVHLDQATVPPGAVGRFTFKMHAPQVAARREFKESFEPVWDAHAWMGGTPQWPDVYLIYTVLPQAKPSVTITSAPSRVTRGEPIPVVADVRDNNRVASVRVGDVAAARIGETQSYRAELPSGALPPGPHTITIRATDPGGRETAAGTTVEVVQPAGGAPGPGGPAGDPDIFGARISSVFVWKGARTRFTAVRIADLPRSAEVRVGCKGRGCRFKSRGIAHGGGTVNVLKKLRRLRLRSGALLQIRLTDGGATKLATWRIRRGKAPKIAYRCGSAGGKLRRCT